MKSANLMLGLGIGLYYSIGVNTSHLWGMFYYTIIVSYMLCCIFRDKMSSWDKLFASIICGLIWVTYLVKTINTETITFKYIRFWTGILFVALSVVYLIYCIIHKINKRHEI